MQQCPARPAGAAARPPWPAARAGAGPLAPWHPRATPLPQTTPQQTAVQARCVMQVVAKHGSAKHGVLPLDIPGI